MRKIFITLFLLVSQLAISQKPIKVLIVDGQNNHVMWPKITYMLKDYMLETKKFTVDVSRSYYTWQGVQYLEPFAIEGMPKTEISQKPVADPNFNPDFSKYDVVVTNFGWNAADWPAATQASFEKFVKAGGGVVVIHAADNSFPKWPAYNKMIGLGGWGDRTEKDGPYVFFDESGKIVKDMSPGRGGSHGPEREYTVDTRMPKHPIMKGIPASWLHTKDELYDRLRGPAENMEILATAFADAEKKGSGRHEPALMTIKYGKGRIFHTILGHADYSVQCVGFITTFLRGAQWSAGKKVNIPVPADFPSVSKTSSRAFEKK